MTVVTVKPSADPLDIVSEALLRELQRRLERRDLRLVSVVFIGDDVVLRDRLAESCAGVTAPVVAVFETVES